jgi:antitoxin YefM
MEVKTMKTIPVTQARSNLYKILDEAINSSEPIEISGKRGNGVLVSKEDWSAIQETLYLLSVPGMRDALIEGKNTPVDDCVEDIGWDLD